MRMHTHRRRGLGVMLSLALAATGSAKEVPTTCQDICDTLTSTSCTVSTAHDVAVGSDVDCTSARDISINVGELRVHDGAFILRGKSLTLVNGGKITADCPQAFDDIGFDVRVVGDIMIASTGGSKMEGRCAVGGGGVSLEAGDDITIGGNGIDVTGTSADGSGGEVVLDATDTVTINSAIAADATGGAADGGRIDITGVNVAVAATLSAQGYGGTAGDGTGGEITITASGDVTVSAGTGLLATAAQGAGGVIAINAEGTVDVDKPLKAQGTSGSAGFGGSVTIDAEAIALDNDINAAGGHDGGGIELEARGGDLTIGTASQPTVLDARGNAGEEGGQIRVRARGSDVTIGGQATIHATGAGEGGSLEVMGVAVTTASAAKLYANGAAPSSGGIIEIEARGTLNLAGTIQANNAGSLSFMYRDGTPTIASGITGYDLVQLSDLPAPCGDGIRNQGTGGEACDGADLGGETCASQSQGTGTLACTASCTFDYGGCSGS